MTACAAGYLRPVVSGYNLCFFNIDMRNLMKALYPIVAALAVTLLAACAPEVGSPKWCEKMKQLPKGEWSMNDARDFASHCIFPQQDEK